MPADNDPNHIQPLLAMAEEIQIFTVNNFNWEMISKGIFCLVHEAATSYDRDKSEPLTALEREHSDMHQSLLSIMYNLGLLVGNDDDSVPKKSPEEVMCDLLSENYSVDEVKKNKVTISSSLSEATPLLRIALKRYKDAVKRKNPQDVEQTEKLCEFLDALKPKLISFNQLASQVNTTGIAQELGDRIANETLLLEGDIDRVIAALYHAAQDPSRCEAVTWNSISGEGQTIILSAAISLQALKATLHSVSESGGALAKEVFNAPAHLAGKPDDNVDPAANERMNQLFETLCPKGSTHLSLISGSIRAARSAERLLKAQFSISFSDSSGGSTVYDRPRETEEGTITVPYIPAEAAEVEREPSGAVSYRLPQPPKTLFEASYGNHQYPDAVFEAAKRVEAFCNSIELPTFMLANLPGKGRSAA